MGRSERDETLVVIPALNEAPRLAAVLLGLTRRFDVLVIDDGSSDGTAVEARRAGAAVARHAVNLGYGAALQTGYRYALRRGYRTVVQMDADGQHDPGSIAALLGAIADADVVVGSRFLDASSYRPPALRRLGMRVFAWMAALVCGRTFSDPTSGFQAVSRRALRYYASAAYPGDFPDADVLAMSARAGLRIREVAVRMCASPTGKSMHAGLLAPLYYVFKMTLALALVPLRARLRPVDLA